MLFIWKWVVITAFAAHVLVIHDLLTNSLHITAATTKAATQTAASGREGARLM